MELEIDNLTESLVLLAYTSRIHPELAKDKVKLNCITTTILGQANKNNSTHHITGVLYYGNERFFQCIEGPESAVRELLKTIQKDPRHIELQILVSIKVRNRRFNSWSMKFIHSHPSIQEYFTQAGFNSFTPEKLSKKQMVQLLKTLKHS